jgi:hypothetical protein
MLDIGDIDVDLSGPHCCFQQQDSCWGVEFYLLGKLNGVVPLFFGMMQRRLVYI